MDKIFDFVKSYPAVIALIPTSIQAIVSLLTLFKKKSQKPIYSNNNSGNQINAGAYSTNTINDHSNSGNTTINNTQIVNTPSSSNTDNGTALVYLLLFAGGVVAVLCFYLNNRNTILTTVFIFVFSFYIFDALLIPKNQCSIIKTILYFILTALCYFFISNNYFKPHTFDVLTTQIIDTHIFAEKFKLVWNNQSMLYYVLFQIGALSFLSVSPLFKIINNIKFLISNNSPKSFNPTIGLIFALLFTLIPAILPYLISTW